jgi:hypothetical protein
MLDNDDNPKEKEIDEKNKRKSFNKIKALNKFFLFNISEISIFIPH